MSAHKTIYEFTVRDVDGKETSLSKYKGQVVIIVNVASKCGYTDTNYKELKSLQSKYYSHGLRVAAFPCNQFGGQISF
ncbi:glutathione peroxidase [Dictyocaulus viviparus]|uniref:Glutathione peroxidase n=1 Tax=Dictyocaulus viviparus TaxID=29172 RepID=A0A0D8XDC5_DICVI|nr:glutathione peroxidase [Dictyocaulus viviparus]